MAVVGNMVLFSFTYSSLLSKGWGMTQLKWFLISMFLAFSGAAAAEIVIINSPNGPIYCIIEQNIVTCR